MLQKLLRSHGIHLTQQSTFIPVENRLDILWKNFARKKLLVPISPKVVAQKIVHYFRTESLLSDLKQCQDALTHQVAHKVESESKMLIERCRMLREQIRAVVKIQLPYHNELLELFESFPNPVHKDVPDKPFIIKTKGAKKMFRLEPKDHVELGRKLCLFDLAAGSSVSGHRFVYLTGWGARLAHALEQWAIDFLIEKRFNLISPPDIVKNRVLSGCGFRPEGEATQVYGVAHRKNSDLSLSGTGEIPLVGYFADKHVNFDGHTDSMMLLGAASNCYRAEAGDRGKEIRGLYRLHQFRKIEMVCLTPPDITISHLAFKTLLEIQEDIYTRLGLHYRQVSIPGDDLGAVAHRKVDIEAWMPGMDKYGEVTSASECLDYQSTRLDISCNRGFVYTLNATAIAIPRTMIAIIENYQQEDGSIQVPYVLQSYLKHKYITAREPTQSLFPIIHSSVRQRDSPSKNSKNDITDDFSDLDYKRF